MATPRNRAASSANRDRGNGSDDSIEAEFHIAPDHPRPPRSSSSRTDHDTTDVSADPAERPARRARRVEYDEPDDRYIRDSSPDPRDYEEEDEQATFMPARHQGSALAPPPTRDYHPAVPYEIIDDLRDAMGLDQASTADIILGGYNDINVAQMAAREFAQAQLDDTIESHYETMASIDKLYKNRPLGKIGRFFMGYELGQITRAEVLDIGRAKLATTHAIGESKTRIATQAGSVVADAMNNDVQVRFQRGLDEQRLKALRYELALRNNAYAIEAQTSSEYGLEVRTAEGKANVIRARSEANRELAFDDKLDSFETLWQRFQQRPELVEEEVFERFTRLNTRLMKLRRDMRVRGVASNRMAFEAIQDGMYDEVNSALADGRRELTRMANAPKPKVHRFTDIDEDDDTPRGKG